MTQLNIGQIAIGTKDIKLGMQMDKVAEILEKNSDNIYQAGNSSYYFLVENTEIYGLSGTCRFLFTEDKLVSISFTPLLKEYIRLLGTVTREGIYSCVDQGYEHLTSHIEKEYKCKKIDGLGKHAKKYLFNPVAVEIAIDQDHEKVSMSVEFAYE